MGLLNQPFMMTFQRSGISFFIICGLAFFFTHLCCADQLTPQLTNQTSNSQNQEIPTLPPAPEQKIEIFEFDLKKFSGERVSLNREYSRKIQNIQLTFTFPPQCGLAATPVSFVNIFTQEKKLIAKADILGLRTEIILGQTIESSHLYLEAQMHYSCGGEQPPSLFKNILFDAPLVNYSKAENIQIHHNFPSP